MELLKYLLNNLPVSKPVKISSADYERLKKQGYFSDLVESHSVDTSAVDTLAKNGQLDSMEVANPMEDEDTSYEHAFQELPPKTRQQAKAEQTKVTPTKAEPTIAEEPGLIAKGIRAVGKWFGDRAMFMKTSPVVDPFTKGMYGMINNAATQGVPSLINTGYMVGKGLVGAADGILTNVSREENDQIKTKDFFKTVGETLTNTIGGLQGELTEAIAKVAGLKGMENLQHSMNASREDKVHNAFWDEGETNKFMESMVTDELYVALNAAQKDATYIFDKPEGYEESSASEYLNPFNPNGLYTYQTGLPSVGFTVASMLATSGLTGIGKKVGEKIATSAMKDVMKKEAAKRIGANIGQQAGYVTSIGANALNESQLEMYGSYEQLYGALKDKRVEELTKLGMDPLVAEHQVVAQEHDQLHQRALKGATNVFVNNAIWLLTTQHLQNKLLGVAPKGGYIEDLGERTAIASSKLKQLFNNPVTQTIGSGLSESIEEKYQNGLTLFESNSLFERPEGPSYLHGLANGIKDGILNFSSQEGNTAAVIAFLTSAPITAVQEYKDKKNYEAIKSQFNNSIEYLNTMRTNEAFAINDDLSSPNFGNVQASGLQLIVKAEHLNNLTNKDQFANLKLKPDATIYHQALGDMAEDEVLQSRLFKSLENGDSADPVVDLINSYKYEVEKSKNTEYQYQNEKMDSGKAISQKKIMLERAHAAYNAAKKISEGRSNTGVFRHAYFLRYNRMTAQIRYAESSHAAANALASSTRPDQIELRARYMREYETFKLEADRYAKELYAVGKSIDSYRVEEVAAKAIVNSNNYDEAKQAVSTIKEEPELRDEVIEKIEEIKASQVISKEELASIRGKAMTYGELKDMAAEHQVESTLVNDISNDILKNWSVNNQKAIYNSTDRVLNYEEPLDAGTISQEDSFVPSYIEDKFNTRLREIGTKTKLLDAVEQSDASPELKQNLTDKILKASVTIGDIDTMLRLNRSVDIDNTVSDQADKIMNAILPGEAIDDHEPALTEEYLVKRFNEQLAAGLDPRIVADELRENYVVDPALDLLIDRYVEQSLPQLTPGQSEDIIRQLYAGQQTKSNYSSNQSFYVDNGTLWQRITSLTTLGTPKSEAVGSSVDRYNATNIGNIVDLVGKIAINFIESNDAIAYAQALQSKTLKWKNNDGTESDRKLIDVLGSMVNLDEQGKPIEETQAYKTYLGDSGSVLSYMLELASEYKGQGYMLFTDVFDTKAYPTPLQLEDAEAQGYAGEADFIAYNPETGHMKVIDIKSTNHETERPEIVYQRQLALLAEQRIAKGVPRDKISLSIIQFPLVTTDPNNRHIRKLQQPKVIALTAQETAEAYLAMDRYTYSGYTLSTIVTQESVEMQDPIEGTFSTVLPSIPVDMPNVSVKPVVMADEARTEYKNVQFLANDFSEDQAAELGYALLRYNNKDSSSYDIASVKKWQAVELFRRYQLQALMALGMVDHKDIKVFFGGNKYMKTVFDPGQSQKEFVAHIMEELPIDFEWQRGEDLVPVGSVMSTRNFGNAKEDSRGAGFIVETLFNKSFEAAAEAVTMPLRRVRLNLFLDTVKPLLDTLHRFDIKIELTKSLEENAREAALLLYNALNSNDSEIKTNAEKVVAQFTKTKRPLTLTGPEGSFGVVGFMPIIFGSRRLAQDPNNSKIYPAATGEQVALTDNPYFEILFKANKESDKPLYSVEASGKTTALTIHMVDFREGYDTVDYRKGNNKSAITATGVKTKDNKRPVRIDLNRVEIDKVPSIDKVFEYIKNNLDPNDGRQLRAVQILYNEKATTNDLINLETIRHKLVNVVLNQGQDVLFPTIKDGQLVFEPLKYDAYINKLIEAGVFQSDLNPWVFHNTTIGYGTIKNTAAQRNDILEVDVDPANLLRVSDEELSGTRNDASILKWFKERFGEFTREVLAEDELRTLLNIRGLGNRAWGGVRNAMMYIAQGSPDWITRHEAFHIVQLSMLSEEQLEQVLNEGADRYGIERSHTHKADYGKSFSQLRAEKPNMSAEEFYNSLPGDVRIIEAMADEFGKLIDTRVKPTTIAGQIGAFFKKLFNMLFKDNYYRLRSYITDKVSIDQLFYEVDANTFGKNFLGNRRESITNLIEQNSKFQNEPVLSVSDWSSAKLENEVNYINRELISRILDKYPGTTSLKQLLVADPEVSAEIRGILAGANTELTLSNKLEKLFGAEPVSSDTQEFGKRLEEFYNVDIRQEIEDDLSNLAPNSPAYLDLKEVLDNLNNANFRFNLYRDLSASQRIKADLLLNVEELDSEEDLNSEGVEGDEDENADTKDKERWQIDQARENPLLLGDLAHHHISTIPRLLYQPSEAFLEGTDYDDPRKHKRLQDKYQKTERGTFVYDNTLERQRLLLRTIGGVLNKEEMMSKLQKLANSKTQPWISVFIRKVNTFADLKDELFLTYSNKYRIQYFKVYQNRFNTADFSLYDLTAENPKRFHTNYFAEGLGRAIERLGSKPIEKRDDELMKMRESLAKTYDKYKAEVGPYLNVPISELNTANKAALSSINIRRGQVIRSLVAQYNKMGIAITSDQIANKYKEEVLAKEGSLAAGSVYLSKLIGTIGTDTKPSTGIQYMMDVYKEALGKNRVPDITTLLSDKSLTESLSTIADLILPSKLDMFLDGKGNKLSAYSYPMYATRLFKQLRANTKKGILYANSIFGRQNPLLNQIIEDKANLAMIHEIDSAVNDDSTLFSALKHEHLAVFLMNAWSSELEVRNDQNKVIHYNDVLIWLGAKSSSDLGWSLKVPHLDKITIETNTIKLVNATIDNINNEIDLGIVSASKGKLEYHKSIIDKLERTDTGKIKRPSEAQMQTLITEYYEAKKKAFDRYLTSRNIISSSGSALEDINENITVSTKWGIMQGSIVDKKAYELMLDDYIYNNQYYLDAYNQLTLQSLSGFKDASDLTKRNYFDTRTGIYPFEVPAYDSKTVPADYGMERTGYIFLQDMMKNSSPEFMKAIESMFASDPDTVESFKSTNATDNMGLHTLEYRRKLEKAMQTWDDQPMKEIYYRNERNRAGGKISNVNPQFELAKPRLVSTEIGENNSLYTSDVKNAETVLTRQYAYKEKGREYWAVPTAGDVANNFDKYEKPEFAFLLYLMESREADKITFGGPKINKNRTPLTSVYDSEGKINTELLNSQSVVWLDNTDYMRQTATPNKHKKKNTDGTQNTNQIYSAIREDSTYSYPGTGMSMSAKEVTRLLDEIQAAYIQEGIQKFLEVVKNLPELGRKIISTSQIGGLKPEYYDALTVKTVDGKQQFATLLSHPSLSHFADAVMQATIEKGKTAKQEGFLGNVQGNIAHPELEYRIMEDGSTEADVAITHYSSGIADWARANNTSYAKAAEHFHSDPQYRDVFSGIMYRIPTEELYSAMVTYAKVLLPEHAGSAYIGPVQGFFISSEDADGDKRYGLMYISTYDEKTNDLIISYDKNTSTGRHNIKVNLARQVYSDPKNSQSMLKPGGPKDFQDIRDELGLASKLDPLSMVDNVAIYSHIREGGNIISSSAAVQSINNYLRSATDRMVMTTPITLFGESLSNITASNKSRRFGSTLIAAGTDVTKDPTLNYEIGITDQTSPVAMLMSQLLGNTDVSQKELTKQIVVFISQPIIRKLNETMPQFPWEVERHVSSLLEDLEAQYIKALGGKPEDSVPRQDFLKEGLSVEELLPNLGKKLESNDAKFIKQQIQVLLKYMELKTVSEYKAPLDTNLRSAQKRKVTKAGEVAAEYSTWLRLYKDAQEYDMLSKIPGKEYTYKAKVAYQVQNEKGEYETIVPQFDIAGGKLMIVKNSKLPRIAAYANMFTTKVNEIGKHILSMRPESLDFIEKIRKHSGKEKLSKKDLKYITEGITNYIYAKSVFSSSEYTQGQYNSHEKRVVRMTDAYIGLEKYMMFDPEAMQDVTDTQLDDLERIKPLFKSITINESKNDTESLAANKIFTFGFKSTFDPSNDLSDLKQTYLFMKQYPTTTALGRTIHEFVDALEDYTVASYGLHYKPGSPSRIIPIPVLMTNRYNEAIQKVIDTEFDIRSMQNDGDYTGGRIWAFLVMNRGKLAHRMRKKDLIPVGHIMSDYINAKEALDIMERTGKTYEEIKDRLIPVGAPEVLLLNPHSQALIKETNRNNLEKGAYKSESFSAPRFIQYGKDVYQVSPHINGLYFMIPKRGNGTVFEAYPSVLAGNRETNRFGPRVWYEAEMHQKLLNAAMNSEQVKQEISVIEKNNKREAGSFAARFKEIQGPIVSTFTRPENHNQGITLRVEPTAPITITDEELAKINENMQKALTTSIKEDIDEVFRQNPELAQVGNTPEESMQLYSQYVDTIFPNSKFKDIVFHGNRSEDAFEEFEDRGAIFFADKEYANTFKNKYLISAVLNIKRLKEVTDSKFNRNRHKEGWRAPSNTVDARDIFAGSDDIDGLVGVDNSDQSNKTVVVRSPNQVHILGNQKDVDKFKEFVAKTKEALLTMEQFNQLSEPQKESIKKCYGK